MSRLVVVSNRVAVPGQNQTGGLAVALHDALSERGGIWFGWSGRTVRGESGELHEQEEGGIRYLTMDLSREDNDSYYNGFANRTLWPLLHFRLDLVDYTRETREGYRKVNALFADRLAPRLRDDDTVWIHDYHLIPLAALLRERGLPVIWTYVAYLDSAEDAGVWGTRTNTPDSLQNIRHGSERAQIDPRAQVEPGDIVMHKRMASPFFETNLWSLLTFHRIDTLIITGGSTSGCVRACSVDSLSRGFRTIVVEECVADKHEIPHFANLADMMLKYADVEPVAEVERQLQALPR